MEQHTGLHDTKKGNYRTTNQWLRGSRDLDNAVRVGGESHGHVRRVAAAAKGIVQGVANAGVARHDVAMVLPDALHPPGAGNLHPRHGALNRMEGRGGDVVGTDLWVSEHLMLHLQGQAP